MLNEVNAELDEYLQKWEALVVARKNIAFFEGLKPITAGWKTVDFAEYNRVLVALHEQADLITQTWMNGRWIATLHLKDKLHAGIEVVEILQRRPGVADAAGLDFVDFYSLTGPHKNGEFLESEPDLQWSRESNDAVEGYDWHSVWFDGAEAKIKYYTVIDIVRAELGSLDNKLTASLRPGSGAI